MTNGPFESLDRCMNVEAAVREMMTSLFDLMEAAE